MKKLLAWPEEQMTVPHRTKCACLWDVKMGNVKAVA